MSLDAAGDHDVATVLLLEDTHPLDRVAGEDGRVLPLRIGQSGRDDVLSHPVQVLRDTGRVVGLLGPEAAEILERLPAEDNRVGVRVLPVSSARRSLVSAVP